MQSLIALVDCNNFYVSCERVFRPDLNNKAVAVLSNNDGCIISRSQEVKDLGIKMAVPLYQIENIIRQHQVQLFSSNYPLYADMSNRVMSILEEFSADVEVYSIDEAFLDLTHIARCRQNPVAYARQIRNTLLKQTGIPVCIGMASTKTLAKLANHAAKKWKKTEGVIDLSDADRRIRLMQYTQVEEVWGVGRKTAQKLNQQGIKTAWDLSIQPVNVIQKQFNIVLARTVLELNGISCLSLQETVADKQQIICSRSFSRRLLKYHELRAALSEFSMRVAEKLRQQNSVAKEITLFLRTNPHSQTDAQYQRIASTRLKSATQDTRIITAAACSLLKTIYKPGYRYHKCGIQLSHIQPVDSFRQTDIFNPNDTTDNPELMKTIDQINQRFPRGIMLASSCFNQNWKSATKRLSQRYTSCWDELLRVK